MSFTVRKGVPADACEASPLLLSSAHDLLTAIFGADDAAQTVAFLQHAWRLAGGQYGCNNHWVACEKNQLVGVITAWHTELGPGFDRATLDSITEFYSLDEAMKVVMRNQALAVELPPPAATELMIGHVAVASSCQRKGVGSSLIAHMREHAIALNKQTMVLDVELSNIPAIRFYQGLGFHEAGITGKFLRFTHPV